MPTDLPKNFSGVNPLGDPQLDKKAIRKLARKAAYRSLWAITKGLALHYGVSLAAVAVILASGFQGVYRTALSVTAIGLLARWFLPNQSRTKAAQLPFQPEGIVELTPEQLSAFLKDLPKQAESGLFPESPDVSPYL